MPSLNFIPFFFDTPTTEHTKSWLWGSAPYGILPLFINENTAHLLTCKINEEVAITLFSSFDSLGGDFDAITQAHKVLTSESRIIQGVFHVPLSAEPHSSLPNTLAQAALLPESSVNGVTVDDVENPYEDHKLYGSPYFEKKQIVFPSDYVHLIQLSYPGPKDRFKPSTWPFTRWIFHLFVRLEPNNNYCIAWA